MAERPDKIAVAVDAAPGGGVPAFRGGIRVEFGFDEQQRMFRENLRDFLESEIAPLVEEQERKGHIG